MKIRSKGTKLDFTQTAAAVVSQAIGEGVFDGAPLPDPNEGKDLKAVERGRQVRRRNDRYAVARIAQESAELRSCECPLSIIPWPAAVSQDRTRLRTERRGAKRSDQARQRDTAPIDCRKGDGTYQVIIRPP